MAIIRSWVVRSNFLKEENISHCLTQLFTGIQVPFLLFQLDHQLVKSHNPVLTHRPPTPLYTSVPHCSFRIEYCPSKCSFVSRLVAEYMQLTPAILRPPHIKQIASECFNVNQIEFGKLTSTTNWNLPFC